MTGTSDDPSGGPGLLQIDRLFRAVISGDVSREEAHAWSVPFVEGEWGASLTGPANHGVQLLHGCDLRVSADGRWYRHGGDAGVYAKSVEALRAEHQGWLMFTADHLIDPDAVRRRIRERRARMPDEEGQGWRGLDYCLPSAEPPGLGEIRFARQALATGATTEDDVRSWVSPWLVAPLHPLVSQGLLVLLGEEDAPAWVDAITTFVLPSH